MTRAHGSPAQRHRRRSLDSLALKAFVGDVMAVASDYHFVKALVVHPLENLMELAVPVEKVLAVAQKDLQV